MISRIEVEFQIPVELTEKEMRTIHRIVDDAARRSAPEGWVHWASGCGSKPKFSKADCLFLGKEPEADSPERGEPTWDYSVYYIETSAREKYESDQ